MVPDNAAKPPHEPDGIAAALIDTLRKHAKRINDHERGAITLKWEPGKDIHIEITGRYKESA